MSKPDIQIYGPTWHGNYNLIGMKDGEFFLQGNLTLEQLTDLRITIGTFLQDLEANDE